MRTPLAPVLIFAAASIISAEPKPLFKSPLVKPDTPGPAGAKALHFAGAKALHFAGAKALHFVNTEHPTKRIDDDGDDRSDRKEMLFTGIGGKQHDHGIHAFHFGPDGKLYFNFGNNGRQLCDKDGRIIIDLAGNEAKADRAPYQEGMIFRCNLDGSQVETLAWNFRNNWEVCVDSFGRLWQSDNDDAGPNVVRAYPLRPNGAGFDAGTIDILTGTRNRWFRPSDVCVAPDGSLIVADWYDPGVGGHGMGDLARGRLFLVAPKGHEYAAPKLDLKSPEGILAALGSPNEAARYLAYTAAMAMPAAQIARVLQKRFGDRSAPAHLRARAFWALLNHDEQRECEALLTAALVDPAPLIRICGVQACGLDGPDADPDKLLGLALGPDPHLCAAAAIALRFSDRPSGDATWANLAATYKGNDRWLLEALGIGADLHWETRFAAYLKETNDKPHPDIVWRARCEEALLEFIVTHRDAPQGANAARHLLGKPERLDESLSAGTLEARRALATALGRSGDKRAIAHLTRALDLPAAPGTESLPPIPELVRMRGHAERGAAAFEKATCITCHQVRGKGINFGPDLSEIGSKLPTEALYEAILYPSNAIAHGYAAVNLTTKSGDELLGFVTSETDEKITLRLPGNLSRDIELMGVKSLMEIDLSLMPAGLAALLTPQELADLVAYLGSLTKP